MISLDDMVSFLMSAMRGDGLSTELERERYTLQSEQDRIDCSLQPHLRCPIRTGYGLGWNILELPDDKVIGHRGSDWSVVTMAHFYESTHDGLIVLLNAPNKQGIAAMVDILQILDPDSPELHGYIARRDR